MSRPQISVHGKYVLCLDGGGVRGLSSLLVLEHLMEEIKDINKLPERPEPAQCFDLICGTSTGGLIALMLGHLGVSLSECIKQYLELIKEIFGTSDISKLYKIARDGARHATPKLEGVLKRIAGDVTMNVPKGDHYTKVAVLAIRESTHTPLMFRNYGSRASTSYVWEVGRATSAATTFFEPISMGTPPERFIDAGAGYNNPSKQAKFEAAELSFDINCFVSIGTGQKTFSLPKPSGSRFLNGPPKVAEAIRMLSSIATDCERVHKELYREFQESNKASCYFRFNVPHGLEQIAMDDYHNSEHMTGVTRAYCEDPESRDRLRNCARKFKLSPPSASGSSVSATITVSLNPQEPTRDSAPNVAGKQHGISSPSMLRSVANSPSVIESDGRLHDKFTTALLEAAMNGQDALVQVLLNAGANANGMNVSGFTALYAASQHGHLPIVNILLDAGADVNHATDYGFTSLHAASIHGHANIIGRLLSVPGINKYAAGNTDRCTALQAAAQEGNLAVVRCFMGNIGTSDEEQEAWGRSLLIAAKRKHKEIVDLLLNAGVTTDFADMDGFTPLQAAAGGGDLELVELFLAKGADVNQANKAGYTPLHTASLGGHADVVNRLLAAGADATRRSREGYLAIDAAAQGGSETVVLSLVDAMRNQVDQTAP